MKRQTNIDDAITRLEQQIEDLREEAARLSSSVLPDEEHLDELRRRARGFYRDASKGLSRARRYGRHESAHVADMIRENPGTASTATLAAAGLIGVGLWWLLSSDR